MRPVKCRSHGRHYPWASNPDWVDARETEGNKNLGLDWGDLLALTREVLYA